MRTDILGAVIEEGVSKRLDAKLFCDEEYLQHQKRVMEHNEMCQVLEMENPEVKDMLEAYVGRMERYGELAYRQGMADGIALVTELYGMCYGEG